MFVLIFGMTALAQDVQTAARKNALGETKVLKSDSAKYELYRTSGNEKAIARLYRFKNYPVIKELNFATKKNKAKLA